MLADAAAQVAPVVSEARTLDRFIAPVAGATLVAGPQSVVELGPRFHQPVPRPRSGALERAQPQSGRAARRNSAGELERRATRTGAAQPHQLCLPPPAGISAGRPHLGRDAMPAFCGRGRSRISRRSSACTNRCPIYSGGLGVLAGDHIKSASDLGHSAGRHRLVLRPGIFPAAPGRNGWQQEEYIQTDVNQLPMEPAIGTNGEPVTVQIETRSGIDSRQGVAREGGPLRSAAARFQRRRQCSGRSRTDFAPVWRRRPRPHPPGIAAGRRRLPRAASHGHHARRSAPERRAQRVRRARSDPQPHGRRRLELRRGRRRASRARWSSPRTRRCPPATTAFNADLIEEHLGPLRERARHLSRETDGAGPRESRQSARRVLHDGAGAEAFAARQCRFGAARRGVARHVDGPVSRASRKTRCRSATSPTACTCPPGWRRRCSAFTTAIWAPAGTSTAASRASGKASRTSTTASCGKRTSA